MKNFSCLFICIYFVTVGFGQNPVPRFSKIPIGDSGSSAYFPEGIETFELSYSEDSSKVYTGETYSSDYLFGTITIKFAQPITADQEMYFDTLAISYLEYLRTVFEITSYAGIGSGHTLDSNPKAKGYIDYWEDSEGDKWAVKAWIDGNYLAIMYVVGDIDNINFNVQQMFLNGFRFPE
jgi:hypothetical protein